MDLAWLRRWRGSAQRRLQVGRLRRAVMVPRMNRRIKRLESGQVGREKKLHDVDTGSTAFAAAGAMVLLTGVAQGDTSLTREGLRINAHSLQLRCQFSTDDTYTNGTSFCRMLIFIDRHNQGANPTVTQLLESPTWLDLREHEGFTRFKILYDKTFSLSNKLVGYQAATAREPSRRFIEVFKKFKSPIRIAYIGQAAPVANCGKNQIFLCLITSNTGAFPSYDIHSRVRFTD